MNRIDIVIPTRNRMEKLQRILASIPGEAAGVDVHVTVVCDGDPETARNLRAGDMAIILVPERRGSIFCRNLAISKAPDAIIYATDDMEFLPGAIDSAVESMRLNFPDDDGVVGFKIRDAGAGKQSRAGIALVGRTYLDRFPERQLFFPGYFHFGAQEVARGAAALGKLYFDEKARVNHYHPRRFADEMDKTHVEGHLYRATDRARSRQRELEGKLWGVTP